ncbi:MAG: KEOPS complex kinase/ATPase Bud32 [Candidatus Kariarchaeaceae archaeon]
MKKIPAHSYMVKEVIALGAEARIYETSLFGVPILGKERFPKTYRSEQIDFKLRKERSTQEARILLLAFGHHLPVPRLLDIDTSTWTLFMEYLPHAAIKDQMQIIDLGSIFSKIGEIIAKFHGLDIIHGDLTTSNILVEQDDVRIIDFGLGYISPQIEDKAVDLLVLKHTLESTHSAAAAEALEALLAGYRRNNGDESIIRRMTQIENRVRYKSHGEDLSS